jgi:CheY-like chemotaxis protein
MFFLFGPPLAKLIVDQVLRRKMSSRKCILCVSRNKQLQDIRAMVLERAGYCVAKALTDEDLIRFVEGPTAFSLVLLCHSVPEVSRRLVVTIVKAKNPSSPILMLYNGYDSTEAKVDGSLHNLDSTDALIEMIGFLTTHVKGVQV